MARNLRIRIDHNICVGNAMCETFAPNVFRLNDNRQSEAVDPSGDSEKKILEAAENCPVRTTISLGSRSVVDNCSRLVVAQGGPLRAM